MTALERLLICLSRTLAASSSSTLIALASSPNGLRDLVLQILDLLASAFLSSGSIARTHEPGILSAIARLLLNVPEDLEIQVVDLTSFPALYFGNYNFAL